MVYEGACGTVHIDIITVTGGIAKHGQRGGKGNMANLLRIGSGWLVKNGDGNTWIRSGFNYRRD
jgi:hypothetical protein